MKEARIVDDLKHMRQAASEARVFVDGLRKADFLADVRTQKAVALIEIARKHSGGEIVSLLEGGYDLEALSQSVASHVGMLMGA